MRRAVLAFGLIVAIVLQGLALASQGGPWDHGEDRHCALHADGGGHHHDGDAAAHDSGSRKPAKHAHADCCMQCACVLPSRVAPIPSLPADRLGIEAVPAGHDSAFLERLKRPPRAA